MDWDQLARALEQVVSLSLSGARERMPSRLRGGTVQAGPDGRTTQAVADKPGRSRWQYQSGSGGTNQVFCVGIITQGKREVPVPGRHRSLAGA